MSDLLPASGGRLPIVWLMGAALVLLLGSAVGFRIFHPDMTAPKPVPRAEMAPPAAQEEALMRHVSELMQRVQAEPSDSAALLELADHFLQLEQWAPAEQFARRAADLVTDNPRAHYLLSVALHSLGRNDEAAASLERAVNLDDSAPLRYSLGILYAYYLKQPDKAAEQFRRGLAHASAPEALKKDLQAELDKLQ